MAKLKQIVHHGNTATMNLQERMAYARQHRGETKQELIDLLTARPGLTYKEIDEALGKKVGLTEYVKRGVVEARDNNGGAYKYYVPTSANNPEPNNDPTVLDRVARVLRERGEAGATRIEIAEALRIDVVRLGRLKQWTEKGFIAEQDGKYYLPGYVAVADKEVFDDLLHKAATTVMPDVHHGVKPAPKQDPSITKLTQPVEPTPELIEELKPELEQLIAADELEALAMRYVWETKADPDPLKAFIDWQRTK